jgi:hypothetical protein
LIIVVDRGDSIEDFEDKRKALSEGNNVGALLNEAPSSMLR